MSHSKSSNLRCGNARCGSGARTRRAALELFPHAQHLLARKKDHQRAEAMLIGYFGAWFLMLAKPAPVELAPPVEVA